VVVTVGLLALGFSAVPALAGANTITVTASNAAVRLTNAGGRPVRVLTAGHYRFVIHDRSKRCGFRLFTTAGVLIQTGKRFVGTVTRSVELAPGTYGYLCGRKTGRLQVR
jgi:hypothetical protein